MRIPSDVTADVFRIEAIRDGVATLRKYNTDSAKRINIELVELTTNYHPIGRWKKGRN